MAGRRQLLNKKLADEGFALPLNLWDAHQPKYLPTQARFIADWDTRFRGFGGGLANGKTSGGVALAYFLSVCFPGNCGYIGRWDGKELIQTTMAEFFRLIPDSLFEVQNKQLGYLRFKRQYGGSEIFYGDLKKEEWASSLNLGWFWFDQAEETDEARWNHGVSRLRRLTPLLDDAGQPIRGADGVDLMAPTYGFATFNPEGTASYLYRFFHPESPTKKPDYQLYQATTYDGLKAGFVTQDYVDAMLSVFPEQAQKRYLEGSWDVFEGKVFSSFDPAVHVIPPVALRSDWDYYVSMDHGTTNPTSIGIWAVTPTGVKIRIREHYEGGGKPVSYHAACCKNLVSDLPKKPVFYVMDPACWAKNQSKDSRVYSIVDEYNEYGVFPVPGQNDWARGFNRMNEALADHPDAVHPVTTQTGSPLLLCVSSCTNWIREMQNYKWKRARGTVLRNAPDEPIDYNDHCVTGDTQVATPSGYTRIKDLVGTQPWVYAYDHERKKLTVAKAAWVAKTGLAREVWKLTHDSGALYATPDHLIMRRDGTYTPLRSLKPKDRLMPFYKSLNASGDGFLNILCQTERVLEHRFVYQEVYGDLVEGNEVHHRDSNHLHNDPPNLEQLTPGQHAARHHGGKMISELQKTMTRETMQRKYGQVKHCARCQKEFYTFNPKTIYCRRLCHDRAGRNIQTTEDWKGTMRPCAYCQASFLVQSSHQRYCHQNCKASARRDRIALQRQAISYETNHRVIAVEPYGVEDVYDLQVEPHHNFVANGVLVHNSIDESRYLFSLLAGATRPVAQTEPTTPLERWAAARAAYNPLAEITTYGPTSWMTV